MPKYDCHKTLEYNHEFVRMCDNGNNCNHGCPFVNYGRYLCDRTKMIDEEKIQRLQDWSNNHPEE